MKLKNAVKYAKQMWYQGYSKAEIMFVLEMSEERLEKIIIREKMK